MTVYVTSWWKERKVDAYWGRFRIVLRIVSADSIFKFLCQETFNLNAYAAVLGNYANVDFELININAFMCSKKLREKRDLKILGILEKLAAAGTNFIVQKCA